MNENQNADPFDSYMAEALNKPVAQVTAALDADEAQPAAELCRCGHPRDLHYRDGSEQGGGCDGTQIGDAPVRCRCKGYDARPTYTPEREAQAHADLPDPVHHGDVFSRIEAANPDMKMTPEQQRCEAAATPSRRRASAPSTAARSRLASPSTRPATTPR